MGSNFSPIKITPLLFPSSVLNSRKLTIFPNYSDHPLSLTPKLPEAYKGECSCFTNSFLTREACESTRVFSKQKLHNVQEFRGSAVRL